MVFPVSQLEGIVLVLLTLKLLNCMQINATGTADEIFDAVHKLFSSLR